MPINKLEVGRCSFEDRLRQSENPRLELQCRLMDGISGCYRAAACDRSDPEGDHRSGAARAAGVPLCVLLGGSVGAVPAYNSNGLWLRSPEEVASEAVELREEGGFTGLKLRLGRERVADDPAESRREIEFVTVNAG